MGCLIPHELSGEEGHDCPRRRTQSCGEQMEVPWLCPSAGHSYVGPCCLSLVPHLCLERASAGFLWLLAALLFDFRT